VGGVEPLLIDLNCPDWPERLGGRTFDAVVALEVAEHLDNPRQFLKNLRVVTPRGGLCFLSTPNPACELSVILLIRKGTFYCFDRTQFYASGHVSILPWWLVVCLAEEAGFSISDLQFVGKMDSHGVKTHLVRLLTKVLRLVRKGPEFPMSEDGLISLFAMRAESRSHRHRFRMLGLQAPGLPE
jgi:2-polyprenyl-3-methyl-5-hydroxy-6-metoxy-1,4-benzoquinol methylase